MLIVTSVFLHSGQASLEWSDVPEPIGDNSAQGAFGDTDFMYDPSCDPGSLSSYPATTADGTQQQAPPWLTEETPPSIENVAARRAAGWAAAGQQHSIAELLEQQQLQQQRALQKVQQQERRQMSVDAAQHAGGGGVSGISESEVNSSESETELEDRRKGLVGSSLTMHYYFMLVLLPTHHCRVATLNLVSALTSR